MRRSSPHQTSTPTVLLAAVLISGVASIVSPAAAVAASDAAVDSGDRAVAAAAEEERIPGKLVPQDLGLRERPLVVLLHWYSGRVEEVLDGFALGEVATISDWIVVAPTGLTDSRGNPYWNATPTCCDRDLRGNDDVAYLRGFIRDAIERYPVDRSRVVVVGLSNGAFMAYRLACEASDLVTAVVAVAGVEPLDPAECTTPYPVSVLHIHGRFDGAVFFGGGVLSVLTQVWAPYPSAEETVGRWVDRDGCSPGALVTTTHIVGQAGFWFGCELGTSVQYLWLPQGHAVRFDVPVVSTIKRFIDHVARDPLPPPTCLTIPC